MTLLQIKKKKTYDSYLNHCVLRPNYLNNFLKTISIPWEKIS